ncbi:MAG: hypothetical protein V4584_05930 [Verrucomicrobiota bacterium]
MKIIKLSLLGIVALIGSAQAATVTIAAGFGGGIKVTTSSVLVPYTMSIGTWNGSAFTQFGASLVKAANAGIGGDVTATTPASVNSQLIAILINAGTQSAVLTTATAFPSDVSSALASSTVTFQTSANSTGLTLVSGGGNVSFANATTLNFVPIPEPSAALLGAIGALGLLRRRRN